jgi:hypothetical protein
MDSRRILILLLLVCSPVWAAAPTRQSAYTPQTTIRSTDVTNNENAIFNYLQAGVDTYSDGSISNSDIASSAAIAYSKLNLSSGIVNADINSSAAIVASKLDLTSPGAIGSTAANTGAFTTLSGTNLTGTTLFTTSNIGVGTSTANGRLMVQGGNVGIGTLTPNQKLTVAGVIYSTTGGIQFPDNTTQTTASPSPYTSGTYLIAGPSPIQSQNSSSFNKIAEFYVPRSGTLTFKFGFVDDANNNFSANIYRNGVAVGVQYNSPGSSGGWTESSQSVSGWSAGDLAQLYVKSTGSVTYRSGGLRVYENSPLREIPNPSYIGGTVWTGTGVPDNGMGSQGDIYLRTDGSTSTTLYVKTASAAWTAK